MKLKKVTLNRNGQTHANHREGSDLKAGQFQVCQHVMLRISGDCCYHSKEYAEYVVAKIEPFDRFGGGRETVTFERVFKKEATDKPADRPLTQEQIDLKNSPLGITLGL